MGGVDDFRVFWSDRDVYEQRSTKQDESAFMIHGAVHT